MAVQLLMGSVLVTLTILIQVAFIAAAIIVLRRSSDWITVSRSVFRAIATLLALTLWLLAAITAAVWIWAIFYLVVGAFNDFETALYFSVVGFTTLGFGDITLEKDWRLISGLMAANGLILFSLSTAFLIEVLRRIGAQRETEST